jgi:hypothetical protein
MQKWTARGPWNNIENFAYKLKRFDALLGNKFVFDNFLFSKESSTLVRMYCLAYTMLLLV